MASPSGAVVSLARSQAGRRRFSNTNSATLIAHSIAEQAPLEVGVDHEVDHGHPADGESAPDQYTETGIPPVLAE
jgi:hypothetical protein